MDPMMESGRKIRVAEHIEVTWLEGQTAEAVCPNCGKAGAMQQVLATDYTPPGQAHRFVLQICPHCGVRFVDNMHTMDYAADELIELGWHSYQSQIGAGMWPISAPLTRIAKPAGAKVLEIGGAYGFGLDFCTQARGWQGQGFDPSPLAAFGARELGLDIRQDYFTERNLAEGPWDVIISTEVIEHLEDPPGFLRLMRRALADDGILLLTTPDAEWIDPALPAADLISLISPDAHLILQTAQSLRVAVEQAGFAHVVVVRESMTLVAYASAAPFTLNDDMAAGRAAYRRYLAARATMVPAGSDLQLGFAGRAIFEAANDADAAAVETAWASLRAGVSQRFGYDLATMTTLPPGCGTADLAGLTKLIPLGLGMILFSWAMYKLGEGEDRAKLQPVLRLAGEAVAALQQALAQRSLGDGLSDNISEIVQGELLLCAAEAGEPASLAGLLARGDMLLGWRGFVALVNAGAITLAAELRNQLLPGLPDTGLPTGLRRDALLSLANFHLAPGQDAGLVFACAEALRALGEPVEALLLGGFTRLVNASRHDEAEALAAAQPCLQNLAALRGRPAEDARLAMTLLDLQRGRVEQALQRLPQLAADNIEAERLDGLYLDAFVRLVNAAGFAAARELLPRLEPKLMQLRPPFTPEERNALFATGILFLQEQDGWRRSAASFARLRDEMLKQMRPGEAPLPLFWPTLRGELVALFNLSRADEAVALLSSFIHLFPGAPEDLRQLAAEQETQG
jgi:SAM-dependent methyltransferase